MVSSVNEDRAVERQDLAERIRSDHHKSVQRKRIITFTLVIIGVLGCVAAMAWMQTRPDEDEVVVPDNATDNYGFQLTPDLANGTDEGTGNPTEVAIYEDFLCPSCKVFHEDTGEFLAEQVNAGSISVTYHPFTFLLDRTTDEYTQRAANAAACVGNEVGPVGYAAMHGLLMEHQPAQRGAGLSDAELIEFAGEAGADDISRCVEERTFEPWIEEGLNAGQQSGVSTTPTVRVAGMTIVRSDNGTESIPGADEIQFAIETVQ